MAIEEDLSLNIESAIDAIGQMAASLQDALTGFFVAFDDAIKRLSAESIGLTFEAQMEGGEAQAFDPNQEVSLTADNADASGAASDVEAALGGVEGSATIDVEGDASGLQSEIQDATTIEDVPELVVPIALDDEAARANAQAFKTQIEDPVEFDVGIPDIAAFEELYGTVQQTAAAAGDTADKTNEGAEATKKAANEAEKLKITWQGVGVFAAQAFASAVAASAGVIAGFAAAAIESESTLISLNRQLGSLGKEILEVNVSGFSADLQQLAQDLGSSDEATVQAVQRIGLLGQTSGAANDEIAQTTSNIAAVASSLRAANPSAGELDEIIERLTTGLARGGRALGNFGIALTSQEIRARAALMTNKAQTAQFDQYELVAAGAALAAEQFGDSIETNIALASRNPQIALENLAEKFGDALEVFGKPFVAPLITVLSDLLPVALSAIEVFANIAAAFLPVIEQIAESVQPVVRQVVEWADGLSGQLEPALQSVAEALQVLFNVSTPLLNIVLEFNEVILRGFIVGLQAVAEVIIALDTGGITLIATLFAVKKAIDLVNAGQLTFRAISETVTATNPWILLANAIAVVVGLVASLREDPEPFAPLIDDLEQSITLLEDIAPAITAFSDGLETYIAQSEIINNQKLVDALAKQGITIAQFAEWGAAGDAGLRQFISAMIAAGDAEFTILQDPGALDQKPLQVTLENIDSLTDAQLRFAFATRNTSGAANTLGDEFLDLQSSTEASAEALFNTGVATAGLTTEARDLLIGTNRLADGSINYQAALEDLLVVTTNMAAEQAHQAEVSGEAANSNRLFAESVSAAAALVGAGTLSVENLAVAFETADENTETVFQQAGLSIEQVTALVESLTEEMNAFVDNATANVPTVADAFKELGPENSAQSLIDSFNVQIEETNRWNAEMTRLRREGQSDILAVVAELGPQQGLLLLDQYKDQEHILAGHLRAMAEAEQAALVATREVAVLNWLSLRGVTGDAAEAVVAELEDKLNLGDATESAIQDAVVTVQENSPELEGAFEDVGRSATEALTVGSAEELEGKAEELNAAVEAVWSGAGGVAETASQIAAEAGVEKFNEIISTGFLDAATANTIVGRTAGFFSSSGLGVGTAFAEGIRFGYLLQEASIIGTVNISLANVYSGVYNSAVEAGRNIGEAIIAGIRFAFIEARDDRLLVETFEEVLASFSVEASLIAFSIGGDIGSSFVQGLRNAISAGSSSVSRTARQIIADAEAAAKEEAESDSPSKVWERLGRDLVSGLANGLQRSSFLASNAAAGVIDQTTPSNASPVGNNISISVPITISGNVDPALGTEIGQRAAAEISRMMRLEARMA